MPVPTFLPPEDPPPHRELISRAAAAARLQLNPAHVDKMVRAEMLTLPITRDSVEALADRPRLRVAEGELTVLRTAAEEEARPLYGDDPRTLIGFGSRFTDERLEETSLRWWRCDPARVLDNELFVVTVATYPVATYLITGTEPPFRRADEETPRQHFTGQLLARVYFGMTSRLAGAIPGHLAAPVRQIMASRIVVQSGGPIGYLAPSGRDI